MNEEDLKRRAGIIAEQRYGFQRRHYIFLAEIISDIPDEHTRRMLAWRLARAFKEDNPRFDMNRWMKAAGVEAGSEE